jgi:hypothetical protein
MVTARHVAIGRYAVIVHVANTAALDIHLYSNKGSAATSGRTSVPKFVQLRRFLDVI